MRFKIESGTARPFVVVTGWTCYMLLQTRILLSCAESEEYWLNSTDPAWTARPAKGLVVQLQAIKRDGILKQMSGCDWGVYLGGVYWSCDGSLTSMVWGRAVLYTLFLFLVVPDYGQWGRCEPQLGDVHWDKEESNLDIDLHKRSQKWLDWIGWWNPKDAKWVHSQNPHFFPGSNEFINLKHDFCCYTSSSQWTPCSVC